MIKKESLIIKEIKLLNTLYYIQNNIDFEHFKIIFKEAETTPIHYWNHYMTTYKNNLLNFWNYLGREQTLFLIGLRKIGYNNFIKK